MKTGKGEGNTKDGNGSSHRRSSEETAPDEKPFLPTDVEMELRETFQKGISRLGENMRRVRTYGDGVAVEVKASCSLILI